MPLKILGTNEITQLHKVEEIEQTLRDDLGLSGAPVADDFDSGMEHEAGNNSKFWQVYFLPTGDINSPSSSITAFCPFTKIIAEGSNIDTAARNWMAEARSRYHRAFVLPRYLQVQRKIWCGNQDGTEDVPVYIIDFNFSETAVAFCPNTHKFMVAKRTELHEKGQEEESSSNFIPSMWCDWRVRCTPIMEWNDEIQNSTNSLTPHYIN